MSLINDALKRATEAQSKTENTPPPEFQFRGVDPREQGRKPTSWIWLCAVGIAVFGAAIVWHSTRAHKDKNPSSDPATGKAVSQDDGTMKVHAREEGPLPGAPLASTKSIDAAQTENVAVVAVSGTTIQETTKAEPTNQVVTVTEAPKPAAPKLQAIVYNPANPSAIVSGKTVFAGDRLGEWRVFSVGRDKVTLIKPGETNLLKLGE